MIGQIAQLFKTVGDVDQVVKWILEFSKKDERKPFAVIKVSGAAIDEHLREIGKDLGTLARLDLYAPIVYGWGQALTSQLSEAHIASRIHETGDRITTQEMLPYLEAIAYDYGNKLVGAIENTNTDANLIGAYAANVTPENRHRVFEARRKTLAGIDDVHFVGEATGANEHRVTWQSGVIPVVSPLGHGEDGETFNINADDAARALVHALHPMRYIMLTNAGGINENDKVISRIVLGEDYERLVSGTVTKGMRMKLDTAKEILEGNGVKAVQIAHPRNLMKELFSDEGSGTYITL